MLHDGGSGVIISHDGGSSDHHLAGGLAFIVG
jgi:hypothetical protein